MTLYFTCMFYKDLSVLKALHLKSLYKDQTIACPLLSIK